MWPFVSNLFKLCIMFSRIICVGACAGTPFVQLNNIPLYRETFCSPVYQLMDVSGVSTFLLLWITLLWTCVYSFLLCAGTCIFNSFRYIPRSGVSGSWSGSIFNFWRNHQTVSQINSPVQIKSCLFSCFPRLSVTPSLQYIWQCFQLFACRIISLTRSKILKNKGYCILI